MSPCELDHVPYLPTYLETPSMGINSASRTDLGSGKPSPVVPDRPISSRLCLFRRSQHNRYTGAVAG